MGPSSLAIRAEPINNVLTLLPLFSLFHWKTQKKKTKKKSSSLLHWLWWKSNFTKQNETKEKVDSWGMKKTLVSEVNIHSQQERKTKNYIYILDVQSDMHGSLYYYVYISAFFFKSIAHAFLYHTTTYSLSLCYWNETNTRGFPSTAVYIFCFYSFLVFCFIVQPVVYE